LNKIFSLIGLAQKAGKVSSGALAVKTSLLKKKAKLLIISQDISEASKQPIIKLCEKNKIPWFIYGNKNELGNCIGKAYRVALTINDKQMAAVIINKIQTGQENVENAGVVEWQK
jgi:ribosomal protein L7Ae-like RNA K-turn-binding protein